MATSLRRSILSSVLGLAIAVIPARAQAPLAERTLVVYNSQSADSLNVANHYVGARGIPLANECAIAPASSVYLAQPAFEATVREPIKACLNALGPDRILYIVFSYLTPYRVTVAGRSLSLDQVIADIWDQDAAEFPAVYPAHAHPYFEDPQSQGNVYAPYVSFADYRDRPDAELIYSVWRLDAANASLAKGLVDKAIQAETAGLEGVGCFDRRSPVSAAGDAGYGSGEWDIHQAAGFLSRSSFTVIEDENPAEFGTAPAPLRCDGAAFYAGWYSYNKYFDVYSWAPGAMGFHLDSASAADPRAGANWAANAVLRGITVTSGAVAEPYLDGLIHPDGFFRNVLEGANVGDAALRNTPWLKWMIINMGDPLYRPFPGGRQPFNPPHLERALYLGPRYLVGGRPSQGIVVLDAPAPPGGASVALTLRASNVTVPANVTVAGGEVAAAFPITTSPVTVSATPVIQATFAGVTSANTLIVLPLLGDFSVSPAAVTGGFDATMTVYLNELAGPGGVSVALTSANPAVVSVPSSVLVPEGSDRVTFSVTAVPVPATSTVNMTASLTGTSLVRALTVRAAAMATLVVAPVSLVGGGSAVATATLTGRAPAAGLTLGLTSNNPGAASVPASIAVAPGATTATFPVTTSIVPATSTVNMTASLTGTSLVRPLVVRAVTIAAFMLAPTNPVGGASSTATVTLAAPASPGGLTLSATSSDPAVATVPASVAIAPGATTATFPVTTFPVSRNRTVSITASLNGSSLVRALTVRAATIATLVVAPVSLVGGGSAVATATLTGRAPAAGLTLGLTSNNPGAASVPASIAVAPGATTATFSVATAVMDATTWVSITAVASGVPKAVGLLVQPPISTITLSPASAPGGSSPSLTVTLKLPAGPGGVLVQLSSSNPLAASSPAAMTVPAGATSASVKLITKPTGAVSTSELSATVSGITRRVTLIVTPPVVSTLSISPAILKGGLPAAGRVYIGGAAPPEGVVIVLASNDPAVQVPPSVAIAPGTTSSATFSIGTSPVAVVTLVNVTASYQGSSKVMLLTINP